MGGQVDGWASGQVGGCVNAYLRGCVELKCNLGPTRKSILPIDSKLPRVKQTANGLGLPSMSSVSRIIENMLRNKPDSTHPANPMIRS